MMGEVSLPRKEFRKMRKAESKKCNKAEYSLSSLCD